LFFGPEKIRAAPVTAGNDNILFNRLIVQRGMPDDFERRGLSSLNASGLPHLNLGICFEGWGIS
jgi:hypothetical protein